MGHRIETIPWIPEALLAMACAIATSRTDGYALPLIWVVVYAPAPFLVQRDVFWLLFPTAQSHAPANCGSVQSFDLGIPVAASTSWKMHANCRSFLFVFHSRPLIGSQVSLDVGPHGAWFTAADWVR